MAAASIMQMKQHGREVVLSVCPSPAAKSRFTTAHSALDALRDMRATGYGGDAVIELCAGTHPHYRALVIGPEHTSTTGRTEIRGDAARAALGDSTAIHATTLDSGILVTGWVANATTGLWQAPVPRVNDNGNGNGRAPTTVFSRQLWVNGARATRAHANPRSCSGGVVDPKADW